MPRVLPSQVAHVIERYYPVVTSGGNQNYTLDRSHRFECASIAKLLDKIPIELLNPPIAEDHVELLSSISMLGFALECWKVPAQNNIDTLHGKGGDNPISIIHEILLKCPDEAISTKAAGLEFIDDLGLRDDLRLDLSTVSSSLSNGEWKAATVLAGSTTEALLLWAVQKVMPARQTDIDNATSKHKIMKKDPNDWVLDEYNKVARELAIIEKRTFTQVDLARGFRNYIHPGRAIRDKEKCSIGTAHSGVAAVEFVIEDLSRQFASP